MESVPAHTRMGLVSANMSLQSYLNGFMSTQRKQQT